MKRANRHVSLELTLMLLSSILVACSAVVTEAAPTAVSTITTTISVIPATETPPSVIIPVPPINTLEPSPAFLPSPPSTQTVEAMHIFFPTVIPAEGAEFRPPIYPVPWALSEYDHFYFVWPIAATYPAKPVWDYRYGGIYFGPDIIHTGVDLPAPRDTEVMAAGPGTVVWAGYGLYTSVPDNTDDPYGLSVAIRHDFGYKDLPLFTVYAHLAEVDVVLGQHMETGDIIGNVGETGVTTGPHLHFEVRLGENDFWETRNPELWLAPPQGYGVLVGRIMSTFGTVLDSYLVSVKSLETKLYTTTYTYAALNVHRDEHYQENMVIGDLPAGLYEINIPYGALNRIVTVEVLPGQVTYFNFYGFSGFDFSDPLTPTPTP